MVLFLYATFLLILSISIGFTMGNHVDIIERCLKTQNHLVKPGVNSEPLANMCLPWTSKSCCSPETANKAHQKVNHLTFDIEHCGANNISEQCHLMFVRELCYYSCDPYIAPWIIKPERSFPHERLMMVPMCQRDCNQWWDACKEMKTCVRNWRKHFDLVLNHTSKVSINKCPKSSGCKPIKEIYSDASDFCETVWDHTWKVVNNSEMCVQLSFPKNHPNPNQEVARFYITSERQRNLDKRIVPTWFNAIVFIISLVFVVIIIKFVRFIFNLLCFCSK